MNTIWMGGGCFWGVQAYFQQIEGVMKTRVGYGQGAKKDPTYQEVCTGQTGHTEITEITYDPRRITLAQLLEHLFRIINPTSLNKQGNDCGSQYRTGVYYEGEEEPTIRSFLAAQQPSYAQPLVVECEALTSFYPAEEYHQDYLLKNPGGYCHINLNLVQESEKKR